MPQKCAILFSTYFQYGIKHITDVGAYDHILFLVTIAVAYNLWHWKKVLWAVTAFTLGHSLSLALATSHFLQPNMAYIEFAIPITILFSALFSAFKSNKKWVYNLSALQFLAIVCFGLIHGLGFSGYLSMFLEQEQNIFVPLLSFNLGIEVGQLIIVIAILVLNTIAEQVFAVKKSNWMLFWMGGASCLAVMLIFENKFW